MWRSVMTHSFVEIGQLERELPQHRWEVHVDPTTGELVEKGCHGKRVKWEEQAGDGYLRLPSQLWQHGFSNGMEQVLLAAHLAHISNRSYVFEDYFNSRSPFPYTLDGFTIRRSRVPLNTVISGYIAGANVSSDATTSRPLHLSISAEYYDHICPSTLSAQHRVVLSANDAPVFFDHSSQIEWWTDRIKTAGKGKRCVEIVEGDASGKAKGAFSHEPGQHAQPYIQELLNSPAVKHFSWSSLVESSAERVVNTLNLSPPQNSSVLHSIEALPSLLVIDLRRDVDSQTEIDQERDDSRLEKRWWYWAGRAGQRLTSADVGANTAAASSSAEVPKIPSTRARYAGGSSSIPHQTSSSSSSDSSSQLDRGDSGRPKEKEKSGGVRIQKEDFDFGRGGRGRVKWDSHSEEVFVVPSEDRELVQEEVPEVKKPTVNFSAPKRKWMWWGSGSRRTSSAKALATSGVYHDDDEEQEEEQEAFAPRIDADSERELELRSLDEDDGHSKSTEGGCRQPTIDQVIQRARELRTARTQPLTKVLILSNRCPSFLSRLTSALTNDGWDLVDPDARIRRSSTTTKLRVDRNHVQGVNVAVDMALAEKAEVFLGSEFSTLSANVMLRRMTMMGGSEDSWML
ncbi:hypothetical protein MD484_g1619, partial [Candolleomyces efflorescens]